MLSTEERNCPEGFAAKHDSTPNEVHATAPKSWLIQ
jgi:hypothetical protein